MLFTSKPPKKEEKAPESTEDEQTGQKGAFTATTESLNEEEDMEKRKEEQKGEEAVGDQPMSEVKDGEEEQAVEQAAEQATDQIAEQPKEEVKTEDKPIEGEEAKDGEKITENKEEEEKPAEDKPSEEIPAEDKAIEEKEGEQKLEMTEEQTEHKREEENKDTPDEASKEVIPPSEESYKPKPSLAEEDETVIQEEQSEGKVGLKCRYGLLEKLFSLLNTNEEINATLAGYFSKVMQIIIEKRKLDLLEYIFTYKEHAINLINHSYSKSIADVLSKVLSNEDKFITGTTGEEFAAEKQELLKAMIKKMEPTNTGDEIINNCSILCTLIDGKQYLDYLLSEEVIEAIFKLSTSKNPMSLRAGLTLIIIAIRTKLSADNTTTTDVFGFSSASGIFFCNINRY